MRIDTHFRPLHFRPFEGPGCHCQAISLYPQESANLSSQARFLLMFRDFMSLFHDASQMGFPAAHCPNFGPSSAPAKAAFSLPAKRELRSQPQGRSEQNSSQGRTGASVVPLRQGNSVSCGQTSVAMAVNSLTGKKLNDGDIARRHGFALLSALNSESRSSGYQWSDGGNFRAKDWPLLEKKLNREKTPVLIGLNGPEFSPSGRGHIVTLLSVDGQKVKYADPADGRIKTTSRLSIEKARSHPDGKFFFYATKQS